MSGPLRILIADDSEVGRSILREILEADGDILVVGEAANGKEAISLVARLRPDLATVDLQMPEMGGMEAIERIMASTPVPILVITAVLHATSADLAFEAVRRGALHVAEKPALGDVAKAVALREHVRQLARVPVIRHVAGLHPVSSTGPALPAPALVSRRARACSVVAIGASTGGPAALADLLSEVPSDIPTCLVVVQHLPNGFARAFARFLGDRSRFRVVVADKPTEAEPGLIVVAPDDRHLVASERGVFSPADFPPEGGHRPSVTALFRSVAAVYGSAAVGVILSGMGEDGVEGLRAMSSAGALTVAQNEASSEVYGMPNAAWQARAARYRLSLPAIAGVLIGIGVHTRERGT